MAESENIFLTEKQVASKYQVSTRTLHNLRKEGSLKNGNNINMKCDGIIALSCGSLANDSNLSCIQVDDVAWSNLNWSSNINTTFQYFSTNCPPATSIQEHSTNKELLKVTDLLGREIKGTNNEVLFYIYDDGTVEKRIILE